AGRRAEGSARADSQRCRRGRRAVVVSADPVRARRRPAQHAARRTPHGAAMNARATALLLVLPFAACGDARESATAGPPLPPLQLRPMLAELKALALQLAAPAAPAQRELREL